MILENFKKKSFQSQEILRWLMAAIFLSAALFRIFNPVAAADELSSLDLPRFFTWIILIIELAAGSALAFNRFVRPAAILLVIFLIFALSVALSVNGGGIWRGAGELFVFNPTPTDFFMHLVFIFILVSLAIRRS